MLYNWVWKENDMGLEVSFVRTSKNVDLKVLELVFRAIESMKWYLGDEIVKRADNYFKFLEKARNLSKDDVLVAARKGHMSEEDIEILESAELNMIHSMINSIVDSASKYMNGNTHLYFNWDKIPDIVDIDFLCGMWDVRNKIVYVMNDSSINDTICRLDRELLGKLVKNISSQSWKMNLGMFMGWFFPVVEERILENIHEEVGFWDCSISELKFVKKILSKIESEMKKHDEDSFWMVSSY